ACALIGHSREDILGRTDHEFIESEAAHHLCSVDDEIFTAGVELEIEERLTGPDGVVRSLITRKRVISVPGPAGDEPLMVAIISDVTQLRNSVEALRESDDRFRSMADNAPVMIWVTDESGASTMFNSLWTRTTGQIETAALGFGWLEMVHPEDRA